MSDDDKQKYKGPSRAAASVGQGDVDGAVGLVAGAAAGAAIGAYMHNEEAYKAANVLKQVEKTDFLKTAWNSLSRSGKAWAGAIGVGIVASSISQLIGYFRGAKKADAALEQFNEITGENKLLKQKLEASEQRIADIKEAVVAPQERNENGFASRLDKERERAAQERSERSH